MELAVAELDWIAVHGYGETKLETFKEKTKRKFYENPLVPIGCAATAGVLTMGLVSMVRGNNRRSQVMMRMRVAAQGLTVVAMVVGALFATNK